MVERLKAAVDRARQNREALGVKSDLARPAAVPTGVPAGLVPDRAPMALQTDPWERICMVEPSKPRLRRERIVSFEKHHPAFNVFDRLRTRTLTVLKDNKWSRIAITSPTKGCGKTVVSCNLAFSFARNTDCRTLLVDMDLRAPRVARCLGITPPAPINTYLAGEVKGEDMLCRVTPTLAVAALTVSVENSAELCQAEVTAARLAALIAEFRPRVIIYDLPPTLASDDVLAFAPNFDCALIVAAAGLTKVEELSQTESVLAPVTNLLGVLLNKSDEKTIQSYGYGYGPS